MCSKPSPKGEFISLVASLGPVLEYVWCPNPFFDYKYKPITLPKCMQIPKTYFKHIPICGRIIRNVIQKNVFIPFYLLNFFDKNT